MTYQTNLEQERRMLFCLNQIQQLGAVSICSLGEYFGSYSNLFNIEETALRESGILRETQIQAFCEGKKRRSEYLEEYEKLAERKSVLSRLWIRNIQSGFCISMATRWHFMCAESFQIQIVRRWQW